MNLQICTTAGEDLLLRDVSTYLVDREVLHVLYCSGAKHNYPLQNVRWFGEITETPTSKTFVGFAALADESLLQHFSESDDSHEHEITRHVDH